MNEATAFAEGTPKGFIGKFRLVWRTQHFTVANEDGQPRYFPTAEKAECEAWRAKHKIEQSVMVRDGEKLSVARSEAEKVFGTIFRKGRKIEVERKERAA
ncbi:MULTISPECIES: hypothetical protein [Brucella]|uniref:Uncharacterized protein n=2 Tax=Brucella TaxID=234 RepID=A0A256GGN1_9HYPH|nr:MULTISPECIES: hypothetical protein [Brucella]KAB2701335.1 hypothetical protein F9L03_24130 [Brucella lupini]KAB2798959.1 hypothetical protein F9L06_10165 [Brucella anthropi]OYR26259.1 hypothetical protein CES86_3727 [Brucella lupini]